MSNRIHRFLTRGWRTSYNGELSPKVGLSIALIIAGAGFIFTQAAIFFFIVAAAWGFVVIDASHRYVDPDEWDKTQKEADRLIEIDSVEGGEVIGFGDDGEIIFASEKQSQKKGI